MMPDSCPTPGCGSMMQVRGCERCAGEGRYDSRTGKPLREQGAGGTGYSVKCDLCNGHGQYWLCPRCKTKFHEDRF
jgi:DnaJ-class molecular chaperone